MSITALEPPARRSNAVLGLREAARFIADYDVPLGNVNPLAYRLYTGDYAADCREIDRIAAMIGLRAGHPDGDPNMYMVRRPFSGGVAYTATTVTDLQREREALLSVYPVFDEEAAA